jgi:hypothetical protein
MEKEILKSEIKNLVFEVLKSNREFALRGNILESETTIGKHQQVLYDIIHQIEHNLAMSENNQKEYYHLLGMVDRYFEEIPEIIEPFNLLNFKLIQTSLFTHYNIK